MKVSDLKQGMVLRINCPNYHAWIPETYNHWSGDPELRFSPVSLSKLLGTRGISVPDEEMIVYLGSDRQKIPTSYKRRSGKSYKYETVRRVMIGTKTCVVKGHNFKYLEPDPGFV